MIAFWQHFHQFVSHHFLPWWHHPMERFSALLTFCEGNPPVTRWFPLTKASDTELWCFLWSAPEQTFGEQSRRRWFETPSRSLWRHCTQALFDITHNTVASVKTKEYQGDCALSSRCMLINKVAKYGVKGYHSIVYLVVGMINIRLVKISFKHS